MSKQSNSPVRVEKTKAGRSHLLTIVWAIMIWLAVGLSVPVLLGWFSEEFSLEPGTVIASPDNSYQVTDPLVLSQSPRMVVESGTLVLTDSTGKPAKGRKALEALSNGRGSLLLQGGSVRIGDHSRPKKASVVAISNDVTKLRSQHVEALSGRDPLVAALEAGQVRFLLLRNTGLTLQLPDRTVVSGSQAEAKFDIRSKSVVNGSGRTTILGNAVSFDMKLSATVSKVGADTDARPFSLRFKSGLLSGEFDGQLKAVPELDMRGTARVSSPDLRAAVGWLMGGRTNGSGLGKFEIFGAFEWVEPAMAFDKATVKLDGNDATGTLALDLGGERPVLSGTVAFTALDLTQYLTGGLWGGTNNRVFDWASLYTAPFQMPVGKQIDADLRVSASKLTIGMISLGPAAAAVSLKGGSLLADIAQFELAGGQGSGQFGADFRGFWPTFSYRGRVVGLDLGSEALASATGKILQGGMTVTAALTGRGATPTEVLRTMSGTLAVSAARGGRIGIDIAGLLEAVRIKPVEFEGWDSARVRQQPFDSLEAEFISSNGTMVTKRLDVVSGKTNWRGAGIISFATGEIDMNVDQIPVVEAGAVSASGHGQDVPKLEFRGALAAPKIRSLMGKPGMTSGDRKSNDRTQLLVPFGGVFDGRG